MDIKLARGMVRQSLQQLVDTDPSQQLDLLINDLHAAYSEKSLTVAARKAWARRFESLGESETRIGFMRHAVNRMQRRDVMTAVYPVVGQVQSDGKQETFLSFAGLKLEIGPKSAVLTLPSDSVLISEHAVLRYFERSHVSPESGLDGFLDAIWPTLPLSLTMLMVAERTALPPVAALPVLDGLLLGVRSRVSSGVPRGQRILIDKDGAGTPEPMASVLSRDGSHYYLNFRTYIGLQEIAPPQARVQQELIRFCENTNFPLSDLFLALLFNEIAQGEEDELDRRFNWNELSPLLAAFMKKDWASVVPKELRVALGIDRLVSDA